MTRWITGFILGTLIIGVTSPWFVRSYLPKVHEASRNVDVLRPHSSYRWRSEGYATTKIGPLGMPGQPTDPRGHVAAFHVALWGDSQAEGVCVDDSHKIAAHVSRRSRNEVLVLPMARSGDDCNDWIRQIRSLNTNPDQSIRIDAHVFLVVQWSDWCIEVDESSEKTDQRFNELAENVPAFMIQAGRNVLTKGQDNEIRSFRFRPGPVVSQNQPPSLASERPGIPPQVNFQVDSAAEVVKTLENGPSDETLGDFRYSATELRRNTSTERQRALLSKQLNRLSLQTDRPCVFLYAPLFPAIIGGKVVRDDPDSELYEQLVQHCQKHGFEAVDLRPDLDRVVAEGIWPRGFHNGQFGVGHYNAVGNEIIATGLLSSKLIANSIWHDALSNDSETD
ncbi:MAG: hypothetical protein KDB00_20085 [Planctomycetales bacterium]|nr:hypothetical protein [Planctomycetales bacterium]